MYLNVEILSDHWEKIKMGSRSLIETLLSRHKTTSAYFFGFFNRYYDSKTLSLVSLMIKDVEEKSRQRSLCLRFRNVKIHT